MKKGRWIIGAIIVVILTVTLLQYKDQIQALMLGNHTLSKMEEVQAGDTISFDTMDITVKEIAIDHDLKRYPELIGKKLDTLVDLKENDDGKIGEDRAVVSVYVEVKNKSADEFGMNFVNVISKDENVLREAALNDFSANQAASDYFHVSLEKGETFACWIGIPVTKEDLARDDLYLSFGMGNVEAAYNRKIKLKTTD